MVAMHLPERQPRCEWPSSVLLPGSGLGKLTPLDGTRKQSPKISWQTTSTSTSKHLHNNDRLIKHLNEKVIEKINEDEVWRRRVQPELKAQLREPRVLLCYDGFGKGIERNARWTTQFLKDLLGQSTDVRTFSFRVLDTERNCRMMQFWYFFSLVAMRRT